MKTRNEDLFMHLPAGLDFLHNYRING